MLFCPPRQYVADGHTCLETLLLLQVCACERFRCPCFHSIADISILTGCPREILTTLDSWAAPRQLSLLHLRCRTYRWLVQDVVLQQKTPPYAAVLRAACVGGDFACRLHRRQVPAEAHSRRDSSQNGHLTRSLAALRPCSAAGCCPSWRGCSCLRQPAVLAPRLVGSLIPVRTSCLFSRIRELWTLLACADIVGCRQACTPDAREWRCKCHGGASRLAAGHRLPGSGSYSTTAHCIVYMPD